MLISLSQLRLIMSSLSLVVIALGIAVFAIDIKIQAASVETWSSSSTSTSLLSLFYHHYDRAAGLIVVVSCVLLRQSTILDSARARSSLFLSSLLTIITGISASRSYFQYKDIQGLDVCGATSTFNTAIPFAFGDKTYFGIGNQNYFYSVGYCLTEQNNDALCTCFSNLNKQCIGISVDCFAIYIEIPDKLLLLSKLSATSLIVAVVLVFTGIMAIKVSLAGTIDPVPTEASIDVVQNIDSTHHHAKVINIDQATPIADGDTSANFVTVEGYEVHKPVNVKYAYVL